MIFMDLKANASGAANWTFRWKMNQANGNTQLYAAGLPVVNGASVLGRWSLTASGNGHFTMTAPDNATGSFDLPADALPLFAGSLRFYIGVQANSAANIGQRAQLGGVRISKGDTVVLEDNFAGDTLDTTKWVENVAAPGGVQFLAPAEAGYLVTWTLPDAGFVLQMTDSLGTPNWAPVNSVPYNIGPTARQAHIPTSQLPPGDAFFRMVK